MAFKLMCFVASDVMQNSRCKQICLSVSYWSETILCTIVVVPFRIHRNGHKSFPSRFPFHKLDCGRKHFRPTPGDTCISLSFLKISSGRKCIQRFCWKIQHHYSRTCRFFVSGRVWGSPGRSWRSSSNRRLLGNMVRALSDDRPSFRGMLRGCEVGFCWPRVPWLERNRKEKRKKTGSHSENAKQQTVTKVSGLNCNAKNSTHFLKFGRHHQTPQTPSLWKEENRTSQVYTKRPSFQQKLAADDKYDGVVFLKIDVDEVGVRISWILKLQILGFNPIIIQFHPLSRSFTLYSWRSVTVVDLGKFSIEFF